MGVLNEKRCKICKNEKWILDKYDADGYYIVECYNKNKNIHIFIDNDLCYYNKIGVWNIKQNGFYKVW